jgi:hypothetical protein
MADPVAVLVRYLGRCWACRMGDGSIVARASAAVDSVLSGGLRSQRFKALSATPWQNANCRKLATTSGTLLVVVAYSSDSGSEEFSS